MKKYFAPDTKGIIVSLESNFVASSHFEQSPCVDCSDKNFNVCRFCVNYRKSGYYKEDEK